MYYGANNIYSINKTLIKNKINTITINSNVENEIHYLVLALLNSSLIENCKMEVLLIFK